MSLASGAQALAAKVGINLNRGMAGFVTNAVGGNAFSGATDLIVSFASRTGRDDGGHSVFYNFGQALVAGPTQGFGAAFGKSIEGTAWASGPMDVAMTALLGEYASGVGEAKLIYDALTYGGAFAACVTGHGGE